MELSKARLSSLVVLTSGAGFLLAGSPVDWTTCLAAVTGTTLAAASANTFNQVYEIRTDGLMKRTQKRPLPCGRISKNAAIAFGTAAAAASAGVLLMGTNPLTAALGLGNIALYAAVYTPLKQVSVLNTAVGAVVGAIPPLMGWAAATGSLAAVDPFLLGYVLFAWQFPHFYSLAWTLRKDYARGGYQMWPCVDETGGKKTAWLSLRSAVLLSTVPVISSALGVTNWMFAVEGLLLNGYFLKLATQFYRDPGDHTARPLFKASLWYLPVLMFLMVFHSKSWIPREKKEEATQIEGQAAAAVLLNGGSDEQEQDSSSSIYSHARGSSVGEAMEHAISCARAVGRAMCAHELVIDTVVQTSSQVFAALWPATAASGVEQQSAGGRSEKGKLTSGTQQQHQRESGGAEAIIMHAAEAGAKANTRQMCPVVLIEEKGHQVSSMAAQAAAGVAAGSAHSAR